jgi:CRISPR/Cas system CMR subunit Cmr4 (Cas7 group RAMP superfamily)
MKTTKGLLAVAAAAMLFFPAPVAEAVAAPVTSPVTSAQLVTTYFTHAESLFIHDVSALGIRSADGDNQTVVDSGWAELYAMQHGLTEDQVIEDLYRSSRNGQGSRGISLAEAAGEVEAAIHDLTGTSPSPGGAFSGPDTTATLADRARTLRRWLGK